MVVGIMGMDKAATGDAAAHGQKENEEEKKQ